ncbi:MAG: hypothetical protein HOG89_01790 [Candidatus Peribacter sp.]|jgi:hypothetical protein|nr:hypothetical protein [Candidatus Peribacter sp.]MBT4392827.1 hypothetical protein [Candidatus Peribacter sp.]MBT4601458.1 hypothetical protein [Candidatus Peribacter sp.]MBT5148775.1 hypothetical protein [Candidatus Peribacter sp.]MBT5637629.1 hypothetical protein [Candidatus Peribacter sp.]
MITPADVAPAADVIVIDAPESAVATPIVFDRAVIEKAAEIAPREDALQIGRFDGEHVITLHGALYHLDHDTPASSIVRERITEVVALSEKILSRS